MGVPINTKWIQIFYDMLIQETADIKDELGCDACKAVSWSVRASLGNKIS
jgi:hypothetical protein